MNGWPLALAAPVLVSAALMAQAPMDKGRMGLPLTEVMRPWTGDLSGMAERRMVRVLTAHSRTQYFIDRGTPRGTAYDQGTLLEAHLSKTLGSGNLKHRQRAHRPRDGDLRQQHLQVLRHVPVDSGRVHPAPRGQAKRRI